MAGGAPGANVAMLGLVAEGKWPLDLAMLGSVAEGTGSLDLAMLDSVAEDVGFLRLFEDEAMLDSVTEDEGPLEVDDAAVDEESLEVDDVAVDEEYLEVDDVAVDEEFLEVNDAAVELAKTNRVIVVVVETIAVALAGPGDDNTQGDVMNFEAVIAPEVAFKARLVVVSSEVAVGEAETDALVGPLVEETRVTAVLATWTETVEAEATIQGFSDIQTLRMRVPKREPFMSTIMAGLRSACDISYCDLGR